MNMIEAYKQFDEKFTGNFTIDKEWYKINCGVYSNNKPENSLNKSGKYSEEYIRARFIWSIIKVKKYPKENIFVEFNIPKGSEGSKSLDPDVVVFKDDSWINIYDNWDKTSALPEELRKLMLVAMEAKSNHKRVENALTKQLSDAMGSYIGEQIFGIYFDDLVDVILVKKEGANSIKRYNPSKILDGETLIEKLNITNRDNIESIPSFEDYMNNIIVKDNVSKLNFETNDGIDEDTFSNLLSFINRDIDRISLSRNEQDFIVEFLTLKVADEKEVKKGKKKYFDFYIEKHEKKEDGFGSQSFRKRIYNLYDRAKKEYKTIFTHPAFWYTNKGADLIPSVANDEIFLIGIVELFQKKSILDTQNTNFNQIIFNNFGSSVEKAKEKQFFTPVPIVDSIIKMVNPQKNETICDPCSGICDFLAMAFRHIYKNELENLPSADMLYGFDIDQKIMKLAELNLVLNGDGNAEIKIMDSLSNKLLDDGTYNDVKFDVNNYYKDDWTHKNDKQRNVKQYNVIVTNPPFGKGRDLKTGDGGRWDIKKSTMELYDTWLVQGRPKSIDMGVLFLENAYKLLLPGGRMAIILSNSIASIAGWEKVREWLISKMRIVALFDLPANTFGETGVATTVIIAYKPKKHEKKLLAVDYELYAKEIENIGYKVKTKDRVVIMSPEYVINPVTFRREKDSKGNDLLDSDFPSLVNDFGEWLDNNENKYPEIYEAFHGEKFQKWEV